MINYKYNSSPIDSTKTILNWNGIAFEWFIDFGLCPIFFFFFLKPLCACLRLKSRRNKHLTLKYYICTTRKSYKLLLGHLISASKGTHRAYKHIFRDGSRWKTTRANKLFFIFISAKSRRGGLALSRTVIEFEFVAGLRASCLARRSAKTSHPFFTLHPVEPSLSRAVLGRRDGLWRCPRKRVV